jgi:hypothetical protein
VTASQAGSRGQHKIYRVLWDKRLYLPLPGKRGLVYVLVQGGSANTKHPIRGRGEDKTVHYDGYVVYQGVMG